jgi:hypothetical protein
MKRIIIAVIMLSTSLLYSCEEVIELDLNSSNPVVVIDGEIRADKYAEVYLSYTSDYFSVEEQEYIEDAIVTLTTSDGLVEQLNYDGKGKYTGSEILGEENTSYELNVEVDNKQLTGSSTIPANIEIKSIAFNEATITRPGFGNTADESADSVSYTIEVVFSDDIHKENYYMFEILTNNEVGEYENILLEDEYFSSDGEIQYEPLMFQFGLNDTVRLTLTSFDKNAYDFYNQLSDVSGTNGMSNMMSSGTPYNPGSNMGEDVVGYFAASVVADTLFIIK